MHPPLSPCTLESYVCLLFIILRSVEANYLGKCKRNDCNVLMLLSGDKTSVTERDNFPANAVMQMLYVEKRVMYVLWF